MQADVIIDLVSDSDAGEVTPTKAAHTAPQNLQPRMLKPAPNASPKIDAGAGRGQRDRAPVGHDSATTTVEEDAHPQARRQGDRAIQGSSPRRMQAQAHKSSTSANNMSPHAADAKQDDDAEARSRGFLRYHAKELERRSSAGHGRPAVGPAPQNGVPLTPPSPISRRGTSQGRMVHSEPQIAIVEDSTGSDDAEAAGSRTVPALPPAQAEAEAADMRPFKRQKISGRASGRPHFNESLWRHDQSRDAGSPTLHEPPVAQPVQSSSGAPFLPEHDILLAQLREVDNLSWNQILPYFPGRTKGSLQTRFCVRVKGKGLARAAVQSTPQTQRPPVPQLQLTERRSILEHRGSSQGSALPPTATPRGNGQHPHRSSLPLQQSSKAQAQEQARMAQSRVPRPPAIAVLHGESPAGGHGARFTPAEDSLLARLKEVEGLPWREIAEYFPGRTEGALGFRYSAKIKNRGEVDCSGSLPPRQVVQHAQHAQPLPSQEEAEVRRPVRQRRTGAGAAAMDGFVSWSEVANKHIFDLETEEVQDIVLQTTPEVSLQPSAKQHRHSLTKLLHRRQLGRVRGVSDGLKDQVLDGYQPHRHFESTCGDVTCLAWAAGGRQFVASSIAVSDDRSMQYNSGLNLVIGDSVEGDLRELPEHHVPRPLIESADNPNALHSMRESQDPRLFLTVAAAAFSPNGQSLYSAGSDKKLRMYHLETGVAKCCYEINHPASVDLLSISNDGFVATGCHIPEGSIQVLDCQPQTWSQKWCLSPSTDSLSAPLLYPSSIKWGIAYHHRNFLLAGFSSDNNDDTAGETALWDAESGTRWELSTSTRNVFDVAWNPAPSSTSTAFAVASTPSAGPNKSRSTRSVIQCYAPDQNRGRQVLQWDCPARDINDLLYCPHDTNLIAAGATDGRVYVWDQRFASNHQRPLHILGHGDSLNVLDHDRDRELADTGVRFLSWGATSSRLYTGSSDGVVKVWNPYSSPGQALVKDVATFQTAIMSGAFNHDFRDLLVGEECGRIHLLSLGHGEDGEEDGNARASTKFKLHKAPRSRTQAPSFGAAQELLETKQIVLRPMGSMPIRQAVQGPSYHGPFYKPSADDWARVQDDLNEADNAQHAIHRQMAIDGTDNLAEAEAADARVRAAQDAWTRLEARHDDAEKLQKAAAETQKAFREAEAQLEHLQKIYGRDRCTLGCAYLPNDDSDIGVHADSRRSEQRIPGALQALVGVSKDWEDMTCSDLFKAGLAGKCTHCTTTSKSSSHMKAHFKNMCRQRVASIKASFKGRCSACSAPVREQQGLCESCGFACFRCLQPVKVLQNDESIQSVLLCEQCELIWERGVLGHELVRKQSPEPVKRRISLGKHTFLKLPSPISEDAEMGYHHGKWEV